VLCFDVVRDESRAPLLFLLKQNQLTFVIQSEEGTISNQIINGGI
jgi:hypothetical protein